MKQNKSERQIDELGVFVHGTLAGLHLLSLVYNVKRKNWFDVTMHGAAAAYDMWAAGKHLRALEDTNEAVEAF